MKRVLVAATFIGLALATSRPRRGTRQPSHGATAVDCPGDLVPHTQDNRRGKCARRRSRCGSAARDLQSRARKSGG